MAYTAPANTSVDFTGTGVAYTAPPFDRVDFVSYGVGVAEIAATIAPVGLFEARYAEASVASHIQPSGSFISPAVSASLASVVAPTSSFEAFGSPTAAFSETIAPIGAFVAEPIPKFDAAFNEAIAPVGSFRAARLMNWAKIVQTIRPTGGFNATAVAAAEFSEDVAPVGRFVASPVSTAALASEIQPIASGLSPYLQPYAAGFGAVIYPECDIFCDAGAVASFAETIQPIGAFSTLRVFRASFDEFLVPQCQFVATSPPGLAVCRASVRSWISPVGAFNA